MPRNLDMRSIERGTNFSHVSSTTVLQGEGENFQADKFTLFSIQTPDSISPSHHPLQNQLEDKRSNTTMAKNFSWDWKSFMVFTASYVIPHKK